MKKFISTILVVIANFSIQAQDNKLELKTTIDEINKIVSQNKLFLCIDNDSVWNEEAQAFKVVDVKLTLKELDVDPFGTIYSVDLAYKNQYSEEAYKQSNPKYKRIVCNVFDINNFDEIFKSKSIKSTNTNREVYFFGENTNFVKLKSLLVKLKNICIKDTSTLTEVQAQEYIYWYFKNFETGSSDYESNSKYRSPFKKYTGDYVIEIKNCIIKFTYNVYDFTFQNILESKKIDINLKDIISIEQGADNVTTYEVIYTKIINSSLVFKKTNGENQFGESIHVNVIPPEEYKNTLIVLAFNTLLASCSKK